MNSSQESPYGNPAGIEAGAGWLRNRGLQILFTLSFAWMILPVFFEELFQWIPNDGEHSGVLGYGVLAGLILTCSLAALFTFKRWPGFLRLPGSSSWLSVLVRCLLLPLVISPVLAIAFGTIAYYAWYDPQNVQDISVPFAVMFYPIAFTPVLTIVAAWWLSGPMSRSAV